MQKLKSSKVIYYVMYLFIITIYLYIYRKIEINYFSIDDFRVYTTLLMTTDIKRFIVKTIMITLFGVILALPHIFMTTKKEGKTKFNWILSIIIGLPALIVSLGITVDIYRLVKGINSTLGIFLAWIAYGVPRYFCSFLFGYIVSVSFVKEDVEE